MGTLKKNFILILGILFIKSFQYKLLYNDEAYINNNNNIKFEELASSKNIINDLSQKYTKTKLLKQCDTSIKCNPLKYNVDGVCVLMYHSIGYEKNNRLRIPQQQFKQQMKYIKDNGYNTLTLQELYNFFMQNKPVPKKSVVITFDDGYLDNYKYAYPVLKELGLKATIFVIVDNIDKDNRSMNSKQLKELQYNGIDIESHTFKHEELSSLSYEKQLTVLKQSKDTLEKILNKKVNFIAYPLGKYNENTIKAAKSAGYIMGFSTGGKIARRGDGIYALHRIGMTSVDGINVLAGRLSNQ